MATLKTLEKYTVLRDSVKIYVPSTIGNRKATKKEIEKYTQAIEKELCSLFGGSTRIENCFGNWINEKNNELISEPNNIIYSFCEKLTNKDIDKVIQLCLWLKEEMKQYCIMLEVNSYSYFIE